MKTKLNNIILYNNRFRSRVCCILMAFMLVLCSCNKDSYNNRQQPNKFVVLSEITAGDTANVPIGVTIPAGSGNLIVFEKLNSVTATITGQGGPAESLTLNESPDFLSNPMAVYSGTIPFQYNTAYTLTASDPNLGTVTATTTIPNDFSVNRTETETDDLNGKKVLRFAFVINDAGDEKNDYIFEAVKQLVSISRTFYWQGVLYDYNQQSGYDLYQQVKNNPGVNLLLDTVLTHQFIRLNLYTKDNRSANASIGSLDSPYRRIFITDSLFNGQSYETEIWIDTAHFTAATPQETGIVQVQVKSVRKELYDYLFQYEKYFQDFGNFSVNNLASPTGNLQNGFGVFGGSVKKQWTYYYDSLQ